MIECRPIQQSEAQAFLHLMCEVFGLDEQRASHIFFSEPFFDLSRKWALFQDGEIESVLTLTPLEFGWGKAVGIAGVATHPRSQKNGFAGQLLNEAISQCRAQGEGFAYLFARQPTLYARHGFRILDEVVSGVVSPSDTTQEAVVASQEWVEATYADWAAQNPARLVRNEQRWKAWRWVYRPCEVFEGGYVCTEPMLCREAVVSPGLVGLPVMAGTRWIGLKELTAKLRLPVTVDAHELYLMGLGSPGVPEMFMTDQF